MGSYKQYMQPGEYQGVRYGIEVWELGTGNVLVESIYRVHHPACVLSDEQRKRFGSVEEAFCYGHEIARELIEKMAR